MINFKFIWEIERENHKIILETTTFSSSNSSLKLNCTLGY